MTATTTETRRAEPHRATGRPVGVMVGRLVRERLPLLGWMSLLLIGMGLLVGALWPSLKETFADFQASLPEAFTTVLAGADMSTPSGWTNAEMMSIVAPAAVIAVGLIAAGRSTAGEEEAKTMGVFLGAPVSRSVFVFARVLAVVALVVLAAVAVGIGLGLGSIVGDMDLGAANIAAASAHTGALGLLFGAVGIAVGAATGDRRLTTALTAGLAGLAFALASFLPLSDSLAEGAKASPWYYYNSSDPLANGADPLHLTVLVVSAVLVFLVGVLSFGRRDLKG